MPVSPVESTKCPAKTVLFAETTPFSCRFSTCFFHLYTLSSSLESPSFRIIFKFLSWTYKVLTVFITNVWRVARPCFRSVRTVSSGIVRQRIQRIIFTRKRNYLRERNISFHEEKNYLHEKNSIWTAVWHCPKGENTTKTVLKTCLNRAPPPVRILIAETD